jgi:hypothetical protein
MLINLMRISFRLILTGTTVCMSLVLAHAQTTSSELPDKAQPTAMSSAIYLPVATRAIETASGPLRVSSANPRYFADPSGRVVYLTGSHVWPSLQDYGRSDPPSPFDYSGYLDFLKNHNHNFFRLWVWEQSRWTPDQTTDDFWFSPHIYQRTGPGNALDGKPKFDLTKFNQAYFDRLSTRVTQAGNRGIYVAVMLFQGWSIQKPNIEHRNNAWRGHPFNAANNINGINGDTKGNNSGTGIFTLDNQAVTALQEAYVRKVIDTLNDQDNVLWDICNECPPDSIAWHNHFIDFIKRYEAGKPKQHPVGFTGDWWYSNDALFASDADWVSPAAGPTNGDAYWYDPPANNGRKVIVLDTDHLWGALPEAPTADISRTWAWKSFTRGLNPILMDGEDYDGSYWSFNPNDAKWDNFRANLGYTLSYARRMNLARMMPRSDLASSGYCLANAANDSPEFLIYLPNGGQVTVDLRGISGSLRVEWFNPSTVQTMAASNVAAGARRTLNAPFNGDAVLYLRR